MTTDAIYEECGSHWSQQVFAMATTQWLQRDPPSLRRLARPGFTLAGYIASWNG